jgi:hypothetical protein
VKKGNTKLTRLDSNARIVHMASNMRQNLAPQTKLANLYAIQS